MAGANIVSTQIANTAGRWVLSTGAACLTAIEGINNGEPINLVVDLATLRIPGKALVLWDHGEALSGILGTWSDLRVSDAGPALTAVPSWITLPPAPTDGSPDAECYRRGILSVINQGIPLQASVGVVETGEADSGFRRLMQPETINGRAVDPAPVGQPPVFIGSNLELREGSVVLFGADSHTGAILRQMLDPALVKPALPGRGTAALTARLETATCQRDALRVRQARLRVHVGLLSKAVAALGGDAAASARAAVPGRRAPANMAEAMGRHRAELAGRPMARRLSWLRKLYPGLP